MTGWLLVATLWAALISCIVREVLAARQEPEP